MTFSKWGSRRDHLEADLPAGEFRFIALDVETSCSDPASICQIGIACVRPDNRIETFATLVNPRMRFSAFNVQLHGIGPEHVVDAPDFAAAFARLAPLLSRHPLIQHSGFDRRAVNAACAVTALDASGWHWGDSVKIARCAWPEFAGNGGHGLGYLKKQLGLAFEHHDAGEDARAAALVVLQAEERLGLSFDRILAARPTQKPSA
ncbi:exonuclease domain-containing protein [Tabrizicola oligotrophica]|uniref:Exonuclease n=1 Tax=Tabrizicola oligotrophica TaxID=2710650 RepID=A0A6M0QX20_9RHOB|nr:exonuclease domain-containing protein [Tabrizicola oligotrophica]NEY92005.1 exonuclease [Tabrizicola oligotrophica]